MSTTYLAPFPFLNMLFFTIIVDKREVFVLFVNTKHCAAQESTRRFLPFLYFKYYHITYREGKQQLQTLKVKIFLKIFKIRISVNYSATLFHIHISC
jgi:hypothetical protein